jgi:hypothetical protein
VQYTHIFTQVKECGGVAPEVPALTAHHQSRIERFATL